MYPVPAVNDESVTFVSKAARTRSFAFVVVAVVPAERAVVAVPFWALADWSTVVVRPDHS